jgi:ribose transport system permease protein
MSTAPVSTPTPPNPVTDPGTSGGNFLRFVRANWTMVAPIAVLLGLIIAFTIMDPRFFQVDNFLNILRQSSVLLVVALASTVVILMGSIDLSVGSVVSLTAFIGAMLVRATGSTAVLLLLPVVGLLCGLFNGALVAHARLPSFLVTLGTLYAFDGLSKYVSGGRPISLKPGGVGDIFTGAVGGFPVVVLWAVLVLIVSVTVARYTRFGRYMFAIGGNEKTTRLSGVSVTRYKVYAFMISGLLAGLGGLLQLSRARSASPDMGAEFLLPAIAAVVMGGTPLSGGIGGPARTVIGVLIIAILGNGMIIAAVNPFLQSVVQGLVVIAAVALTMDRRKMQLVK